MSRTCLCRLFSLQPSVGVAVWHEPRPGNWQEHWKLSRCWHLYVVVLLTLFVFVFQVITFLCLCYFVSSFLPLFPPVSLLSCPSSYSPLLTFHQFVFISLRLLLFFLTPCYCWRWPAPALLKHQSVITSRLSSFLKSSSSVRRASSPAAQPQVKPCRKPE